MRQRRTAWLVAAGVTLLVDLSSKLLASRALAHEPVHVIGSFWLRLSHNSGVAFGLGRSLPAVVMLTLTALLCVALTVGGWTGRLPANIALGLVLGGAVGNLVDRVIGGSVVDFLDVVRWWPSFNLADVAVTLGAVGLAWTFGHTDPAEASDGGEHRTGLEPRRTRRRGRSTA